MTNEQRPDVRPASRDKVRAALEKIIRRDAELLRRLAR